MNDIVFETLKTFVKKYPNDQDLGKTIREIVRSHTENSIEKNQRSSNV